MNNSVVIVLGLCIVSTVCYGTPLPRTFKDKGEYKENMAVGVIQIDQEGDTWNVGLREMAASELGDALPMEGAPSVYQIDQHLQNNKNWDLPLSSESWPSNSGFINIGGGSFKD